MTTAVDDATQRVTNIVHNLAGMAHEQHANMLLRTEAADVLLAAHEHLENARRHQDIYDEWGFFTKISLSDVKGKPRERKGKGQSATGIGSPENVTKEGDDRWTLIKEAHTNVETGVLNVEAAAREWLACQLSSLEQRGGLPVEYHTWATLVAWAPNTARTVELAWDGVTVQRQLKAGEYMISLPKLCEALREIGKAAWAAAFERLEKGVT